MYMQYVLTPHAIFVKIQFVIKNVGVMQGIQVYTLYITLVTVYGLGVSEGIKSNSAAVYLYRTK